MTDHLNIQHAVLSHRVVQVHTLTTKGLIVKYYIHHATLSHRVVQIHTLATNELIVII